MLSIDEITPEVKAPVVRVYKHTYENAVGTLLRARARGCERAYSVFRLRHGCGTMGRGCLDAAGMPGSAGSPPAGLESQDSGSMVVGEPPRATGPAGPPPGGSPIILIHALKAVAQSEGRVGVKAESYRAGKARGQAMAAWLVGQDPARAEKLRGCGSVLLLRDYYEKHVVRLRGGYFCHQPLLCPVCAKLRGAKAAERYWSKLVALTESRGKYVPVMFTLTQRSGEDVRERLLGLLGALRGILARRRHVKACRLRSEWRKFAGGVMSCELKRGKGGGWHVHVHGLGLLTAKVDVKAWSMEWAQLLGQEVADTHLKVLRGWKLGDDEMMRQDFLEVFKYAVKFSEMTYDDTWSAWQAAARQKLLRPFGVFRGVKVPIDFLEDGLEGEPFWDWVARFERGTYRIGRVEKEGL